MVGGHACFLAAPCLQARLPCPGHPTWCSRPSMTGGRATHPPAVPLLASKGKPKGQLSVELLVAFTIFLSLLAISYAASMRLASATSARLDIELANSSASQLSSAIGSACSLGSGNVRMVEISGKPATLAYDGSSLAFTAGAFTSQIASPCPFLISNPGPSSSFRVENLDGKIEIS